MHMYQIAVHILAIVRVLGLTALAGPAVAERLDHTTSWFGNSFSGRDGQWVQNFVDGLAVAPDGTVYVNSNWDEGTREVGIYKAGQALPFDAGLHGWGRGGGYAVALDDRYLYVTMAQGGCDGGTDALNDNGLRAFPPCPDTGEGPVWQAIRRYDRITLQPVAFPGGYGHDGSFLIVDISPPGDTVYQPLAGLAVYEDEIYVSSPLTNSIRVFDARTLALRRVMPVVAPDEIAFDRSGSLWVIQTAPAGLLRLTRDGRPHADQLALDPAVRPVALVFDPQDRLLLADNGVDQNIKIYAAVNGHRALSATFGETGGVYSGPPGATGPTRFQMLRGIGVDAAGRITVGMGGATGTEIRSFDLDGSLLWELNSLTFVDSPGADAATDGLDVYTTDSHFRMDYARPPGQEAHYANVTLDPFGFPDDPRLHLSAASVLFRRIDDWTLMFVIGMYSSELQVFRYDPANHGAIAIPSVLFTTAPLTGDWQPPGQPPTGATIWRVSDGNGGFDPGEYDTPYADNAFVWGWWVDELGTVWRANREDGLRRFPLLGFDPVGNPRYSVASSNIIPNPPPFDDPEAGDINRIIYLPAEDQMILSGYSAAHPNPANDWGQVGRIIAIYDNWSVGGWSGGGQGNRAPDRQIVLPYGPDLLPKAMAVAGDYIFVGYLYSARIEVFDRHTTAHLGHLGPDETVGSTSGWLDLPYAISALQQANGDYLIFAEEDLRAKIIMYRWRP